MHFVLGREYDIKSLVSFCSLTSFSVLYGTCTWFSFLKFLVFFMEGSDTEIQYMSVHIFLAKFKAPSSKIM